MKKQFDPALLPDAASKSETVWKRYFAKNKKKIEKMDSFIHELHDKFSEEIDCLSCGNCCRTLGPRITDKDAERMSKALGMKASRFAAEYLKTDEDGDTIFQSMPCPFLDGGNYCAVYESRPKACREYPHTDRKRFYQIYHLSVKNAYTCPIVFKVLEEIVKK